MVPPKSSIVLFIVEKSRYDMSAAAKIKKAQELKDAIFFNDEERVALLLADGVAPTTEINPHEVAL